MIRIGSETPLREIIRRIRLSGAVDARLSRDVQAIIQAVRTHGDSAVRKFSRRFDRVDPFPFQVEQEAFREAYKAQPRETLQAMERAAERIRTFHEAQRRESITLEEEGCTLTLRIDPIENVGVYAPGGLAPYPSTVLMDVIPAQVAGCESIFLASAPKPDFPFGINPVILAACEVVGLRNVYRIGGAQAIAALAYGTETISPVDMICGPGNLYVCEAKRQVQGDVKIDSLAGPSEILILADDSARPDFIAADLIAQIEHGSDAKGILVSPEEDLFSAVAAEIREQVPERSRRDILAGSIGKNCYFVHSRDLDHACEIADAIAPEHLEILTRRAQSLVPRLHNAGAIFVGPFSPEPVGDYMAGPNHVLPTEGCARFSSPLNVDDFLKKTSILRFERESLQALADDTIRFAEAEGLDGHAEAVRIRFARRKKKGSRRKTSD